jgi:hypothetical protein
MLIKFLRKILFKFNVNLIRTTEDLRLKSFFSLINPVICDKELIRVGGNADGGYLIPNDLEGLSGCFSPGVAYTATFELEMARMGIRSYLADYSVNSAPIVHPLLDFEKKYIGIDTNDMYMTLKDWYENKTGLRGGEYILQMDIEGAEYEVLSSIDDLFLKNFRIMVIEFHNLHYIVDPAAINIIEFTFKKILKNFEIVHMHPNNESRPVNYHGFKIPNTMEFTFLRKDRILQKSLNTSFPHQEDMPNFKDREDFPLPKCWYAH